MDTLATTRWSVWQRLFPLALIIAGLVAYHNSFTGPFIFDDKSAVSENPFVRQLWPLGSAMSAPAQSAVAGRPVISLTLAINYAISGLQVWSYHLFNVAIHLLNALFLWGIVRRTLRSERLRSRYESSADGLGFAVALIWILHPLQTEAVDYIVQRTELLMAVFFLMTMYCFIRSLASPRPTRWQFAAVVACALGMGSKEVMVSAPLMVLLYDWVFVGLSLRGIWRQRKAFYLGLAGTWGILVALVVTTPRAATGLGLVVLTSWDYLKTECGVILRYLRLCFWSDPLVIDYEDWPVAKTLGEVLPAGIVVVSLLAASAWAIARRCWLGFLGGWFFLILGPTSSFLPSVGEVLAERRMYLPLAAVVTLAVVGAHVGLNTLFRRVRFPLISESVAKVGPVIFVSVFLAGATIARNKDYRSEVAIWSDVVAKRPQNPRAHLNLGKIFYDQQKWDEALAHFRKALHLPTLNDAVRANAYTNIGLVLAQQGQRQKAMDAYGQALRIDPRNATALLSLGVVLAEQGRFEEAITQYGKALRADPNNASAHYDFGIALAHIGHLAEAIDHYRQALRINPDDAMAHYNLANALADQGKLQEAIPEYFQTIRLQPDHARAHNNLGSALLRTGQFEAASAQFSEAIRSQPDLVEAYANGAMALAAQGKSQEALAQYRQALRLAKSRGEKVLADAIEKQIQQLQSGPPANSGG